MAESTADSKKTTAGPEVLLPPQENNNTNNAGSNTNTGGLVEAVAIDVTDEIHPQQARVIVYEYTPSSTNPPVRNNSAVQCCYPITVDDPVEMVQARNVAITQLCVEILAILFCSTEFCGATLFLSVVSSSVIACCCKHRSTFTAWVFISAVVGWLHAIAAAEAFQAEYYYHSYPPMIIFLMQMSLCGVNMLAVYRGCKTMSALREPIHPVERQLAASVQVSMHPPAQIQPVQASFIP